MRLFRTSLAFFLASIVHINAQCPYAHLRKGGAASVPRRFLANVDEAQAQAYRQAAEALDWNAVTEDIKTTLTTSQDFFPADNGNYGPLMIRLAWHCAGTYRYGCVFMHLM